MRGQLAEASSLVSDALSRVAAAIDTLHLGESIEGSSFVPGSQHFTRADVRDLEVIASQWLCECGDRQDQHRTIVGRDGRVTKGRCRKPGCLCTGWARRLGERAG